MEATISAIHFATLNVKRVYFYHEKEVANDSFSKKSVLQGV